MSAIFRAGGRARARPRDPPSGGGDAKPAGPLWRTRCQSRDISLLRSVTWTPVRADGGRASRRVAPARVSAAGTSVSLTPHPIRRPGGSLALRKSPSTRSEHSRGARAQKSRRYSPRGELTPDHASRQSPAKVSRGSDGRRDSRVPHFELWGCGASRLFLASPRTIPHVYRCLENHIILIKKKQNRNKYSSKQFERDSYPTLRLSAGRREAHCDESSASTTRRDLPVNDKLIP